MIQPQLKVYFAGQQEIPPIFTFLWALRTCNVVAIVEDNYKSLLDGLLQSLLVSHLNCFLIHSIQMVRNEMEIHVILDLFLHSHPDLISATCPTRFVLKQLKTIRLKRPLKVEHEKLYYYAS